MNEDIDKIKAQEQKAINNLVFASLNEQKSKRRWGIFFKLIFFAYLISVTSLIISKDPMMLGQKHAAVIKIEGGISSKSSNASDLINSQLRLAFKNEKTEGIILQINSPGGSAVESYRIYKEILRLREKYPEKKIYAVVGDLCASGGYFIASATDAIYGNEASLIGSIGVIFSGFGFVDTLERLGIERRVQTAGESKNLLDPFSPQRPEDKHILEGILNDTYQEFIEAVKVGRGDRLKQNSEIFSGRIFSGKESLNLGLIDGFNDVNSVARDLIKVETIRYLNQEEWFEGFLGNYLSKSIDWNNEGGIRAILH